MEFEKHVEEVKEEKEDLSSRLVRWPECYYDEIDYGTRKAILELADNAGLTPDDNKIRHEIYDLRYSGGKTVDGDPIDSFVRAFMEVKFLIGSSGTGLFKAGKKKKVKKILESINYFDYCGEEESRRKSLYCDELLHMGRLYVTLCRRDKQYGSIMMGLGRMKDGKIVNKIANDIFSVAHEVPASVSMTDEMREWTNALDEAFCSLYPSEASGYRSFIK